MMDAFPLVNDSHMHVYEFNSNVILSYNWNNSEFVKLVIPN
jgi:hypothetical protein